MIELDSDSIKFADVDSLYEALFFTLEAILPNQDENRLSPRHAVLPKGKGELHVLLCINQFTFIINVSIEMAYPF